MAVISPQPQRLELQAYAILPGPHIRPLKKKKKKTAKNISTQMSVDSEAVCCKSCLSTAYCFFCATKQGTSESSLWPVSFETGKRHLEADLPDKLNSAMMDPRREQQNNAAKPQG